MTSRRVMSKETRSDPLSRQQIFIYILPFMLILPSYTSGANTYAPTSPSSAQASIHWGSIVLTHHCRLQAWLLLFQERGLPWTTKRQLIRHFRTTQKVHGKGQALPWRWWTRNKMGCSNLPFGSFQVEPHSHSWLKWEVTSWNRSRKLMGG